MRSQLTSLVKSNDMVLPHLASYAGRGSRKSCSFMTWYMDNIWEGGANVFTTRLSSALGEVIFAETSNVCLDTKAAFWGDVEMTSIIINGNTKMRQRRRPKGRVNIPGHNEAGTARHAVADFKAWSKNGPNAMAEKISRTVCRKRKRSLPSLAGKHLMNIKESWGC